MGVRDCDQLGQLADGCSRQSSRQPETGRLHRKGEVGQLRWESLLQECSLDALRCLFQLADYMYPQVAENRMPFLE